MPTELLNKQSIAQKLLIDSVIIIRRAKVCGQAEAGFKRKISH